MNEAQLALFDYNTLNTNIRGTMQHRAERIRQRSQVIAINIWENGRDFYEAQQELAKDGYGCFQDWAESETAYSIRTVYNFIRVYQRFDCANFAQSNLAPSALYMLAAPSTPDQAVEEAIERAEAGERITYTGAKEIVSQYKGALDGSELGPRTQNPRAPLITNDLGSYRQLAHDTKQCETCGSLWMADLDYCPYCHVKPEIRAFHATQEQRRYPLAASNHVVSDDEDYDGDEWFTPAEYIEAARDVMGEIDLDPASCEAAQEIVGALKFYTKEDDSLRPDIEWHGRIWLNPPYSTTPIKRFVAKLIAQYEAGNVTEAIILTNNSSDTGWFHDLLSRYPACFTRGRVQFWRPDSDAFGARQGQTLFYLGEDFESFRFTFSQFGQVVVKA